MKNDEVREQVRVARMQDYRLEGTMRAVEDAGGEHEEALGEGLLTMVRELKASRETLNASHFAACSGRRSTEDAIVAGLLASLLLAVKGLKSAGDTTRIQELLTCLGMLKAAGMATSLEIGE